MKEDNSELWTIKGATLSDKSVRKEYKLTQEEILEGINSGELRYRVNYIYGNPWFRLLRCDVEDFIKEKKGTPHLEIIKLKAELKKVETELRALKKQAKLLEMRKKTIQAELDIEK